MNSFLIDEKTKAKNERSSKFYLYFIPRKLKNSNQSVDLSGPAKKQSHLLKNNCFQGFPLDANSNAGLFGSGASCENRKAVPPKTTSKDAFFVMIPSSASALPIKRLVSLCSAKL